MNPKHYIPQYFWIVLLIAVFFSAPVAGAFSVDYGPARVATGYDFETPCVVYDTSGNAHIVWTDNQHLYYKMVDSAGNVLINTTNLNPCAAPEVNHTRRPSLAIDSAGALHIVFHGFSLYTGFGAEQYTGATALSTSEVIYLKINPSLDDRSGDAADFYTVTVIPETIISTQDANKSRAPNIAADALGRLHVVWWDGPGWDSCGVHYKVMNLTGGVISAETALNSGLYVDPDWGEPEIAVDTDGNAHIVYTADFSAYRKGEETREVSYTMVSAGGGRAAATLIDDTMITAADGSNSTRAFVAVDSLNKVHVVWHDMRLVEAAELYYSHLDPSLDDQDGSPADPAVISVITEQLITINDSSKSHLANLDVDQFNRVHVVWVDYRDDLSNPELYYQAFQSAGETLISVVPETRLTTTGDTVQTCDWIQSSGRNADITVLNNRVYITFHAVDNSDGWEGIYLVFLDVPGGEPDTITQAFDSGDTASAYVIFSIPLHPTNPTAEALFGNQLRAYDTTQARIGHWNPATQAYDEYPALGALIPGWAGWFLFRNGLNLTINGTETVTIPGPNDTNGYPYVIKQGWNQVGNPFNYSISLEDIIVVDSASPGDWAYLTDECVEPPRGEVCNNITDPVFWVWEGGEYLEQSGALEPGRGGWIYKITPGDGLIYFKAGDVGRTGLQPVFKRSDRERRPPAPPRAFEPPFTADGGGGGCFIRALEEK